MTKLTQRMSKGQSTSELAAVPAIPVSDGVAEELQGQKSVAPNEKEAVVATASVADDRPGSRSAPGAKAPQVAPKGKKEKRKAKGRAGKDEDRECVLM